jgi:hypothetical protein
VLKNWEPIQQVAVLLLIRGTLSGSEVLQGTISPRRVRGGDLSAGVPHAARGNAVDHSADS